MWLVGKLPVFFKITGIFTVAVRTGTMVLPVWYLSLRTLLSSKGVGRGAQSPKMWNGKKYKQKVKFHVKMLCVKLLNFIKLCPHP